MKNADSAVSSPSVHARGDVCAFSYGNCVAAIASVDTQLGAASSSGSSTSDFPNTAI